MRKLAGIAAVMTLAALPAARGQDFAVLPSPAGWVYRADLDGDGLDDSLTSGGGTPFDPPHDALVRHGLGNGLLGEEQFVECPGSALLLAGDTMGDGLADIVLLTPATVAQPQQLVVVPNVPGAGFGAAVSSASTIVVSKILPSGTSGFSSREAIADMDGDGLDDLVVDVVDPNQPGAQCTLTVARSTGDGTFVETAHLPSPWVQFVVGDFDADGQLDAATIDNDGTLLHYSGLGGGQLSTTPVASIIVEPWFDFGACITHADFDQDGLDDIAATGSAATSGGGGVAVIMHAAGDGSFAPTSIRHTLSPSIASQGDLNGDGWPDLVLGVNHNFGIDQPAPGISTCLNDGSGGLLPEVVTDMDVSVSETGTEFPVRDFDGDGRADIGLWFILSGQGDGTFVHRQVLQTGESPPSLVAAADLNLDGKLDLVGTLEASQDPLSIQLGHGDGTFDDPIQPPIPGYANELAIADLNTDGVPDLILDQGLGEGLLTASYGTGDGTSFSPPATIASVDAVDIGVADLDGNGTLDVAVTRKSQLDAWIMLGDGAGHFAPPMQVPLGGKGNGLALADIDGEGSADIASALIGTNHVALALGLASGGFAAPQSLATNNFPNHVSVADFNEDGLSDLALSNSAQDTTLFLATAPAIFGPAVELEGPGNSHEIGTSDLDRDGHIDIVVSSPPIGIGFLRGHGNGTFSSVQWYESSGGSQGLALGDFNSDAFPDVAVAESVEGSLSVLLNVAAVLPSLGFQHDAGSGFPYLTGTGTTEPRGKVSLKATLADSLSEGLLVVGMQFAPQAFQGGVLVPSTDGILPFEANILLTGRWPDLPAGAAIYLQAWFPTSAGEAAASNAVVGITH